MLFLTIIYIYLIQPSNFKNAIFILQYKHTNKECFKLDGYC